MARCMGVGCSKLYEPHHPAQLYCSLACATRTDGRNGYKRSAQVRGSRRDASRDEVIGTSTMPAVMGDPRRPDIKTADDGYKMLAASLVIDAVRNLGRESDRQFLKSEFCELICDVLNVNHDAILDAVRNHVNSKRSIQAKIRIGLQQEGVDYR